MGNKLEVLRGFCLSPGKDVAPGDELDEHEIGKNRADQLCSGASPKCRRIGCEGVEAGAEAGAAGGNVGDDGPKPKTAAEKKAAKKAAAAAKKRVPGNLRHR